MSEDEKINRLRVWIYKYDLFCYCEQWSNLAYYNKLIMKKQEIENTLDEKELWLWTFFIIATLVVFIWWLFWYFVNNMEERWTFWDMFGAINALFSGLALAGIIYTMLLQKQELRLQRLELKANREDLARAATAQENSERALRQQAENLKVTARLNALSTLMNLL